MPAGVSTAVFPIVRYTICMTTKEKIFYIVSLLIIIGAVGVTFYRNTHETPEVPNSTITQILGENDNDQMANYLKLDDLKAGDTVSFPLTVTGEAKGLYFEGSFPTQLRDSDGNQLAIAPAQAKGDWMVDAFVPFSVTFDNVDTGGATEGVIVFMKDNPSDLRENDRKFEIPVTFSNAPAGPTTSITLYFPNSDKDPNNFDCSVVYPVKRSIPKTAAVGRASMLALLKGPTDAEKAAGYFSNIDEGAHLNDIQVGDGAAFVDFGGIPNGGSCRVASIRAEIEKTLKQFPTVQSVSISIDGKIDDVLQP